MLKKRLAGVITVKDGWAVQSFGYERYLPLGRPQCLAENLDRWGADEILVLCVDRSRLGLGPDFELLRSLGSLGLSTPVTYGGGVRTVQHAAAAIQSGAERLCLDTALHAEPAAVREMASLLGAQALVAALPLSEKDGQILRYDYVSKRSMPLSEGVRSLFAEGVVSEALAIDWLHEGQRNAFNTALVQNFPLPAIPLIAFGGLSEPSQIAALLELPRVVAAGVGNFLSYAEHAVQGLKEQMNQVALRPALYAADY